MHACEMDMRPVTTKTKNHLISVTKLFKSNFSWYGINKCIPNKFSYYLQSYHIIFGKCIEPGPIFS